MQIMVLNLPLLFVLFAKVPAVPYIKIHMHCVHLFQQQLDVFFFSSRSGFTCFFWQKTLVSFYHDDKLDKAKAESGKG